MSPQVPRSLPGLRPPPANAFGPTLHNMIRSSWLVAALWWLRQHFDDRPSDDLYLDPIVHVRWCLREHERLNAKAQAGTLQPWDDLP